MSREKQGEEFADLLAWLGQVLGEDVTEARLSSRLTDSAACLVGDAYSMSPQLEKLYRASGSQCRTRSGHSNSTPRTRWWLD